MLISNRTAFGLTIEAPAKVNLNLEILGRRDDGFHEIDSLFQAVSLCDRIEVSMAEEGEFELSVSGTVELPEDESNIVTKAFRLMQDRFALKGGLRVELQKRIPIAAGLGGGSADGAAAMLAINLLYGLGQSTDALAELSGEIGSDLPFFFSGGQARVTGRGERVEPIELPLDYSLVLITPELSISTADAYAGLRMGLTVRASQFSLACCRSADELVDSMLNSGNGFERLMLDRYPELAIIKQALSDSGALLARMSGSGPTVFGAFVTRLPADLKVLTDREGWRYHEVRPIRYPVVV